MCNPKTTSFTSQDEQFVIQSAYLAAFLDADGSVFAQIVPKEDYKHKYQIRLTVSFHQKTKRKHFLDLMNKHLGKKGSVRDRNDQAKISELNFPASSTGQRVGIPLALQRI